MSHREQIICCPGLTQHRDTSLQSDGNFVLSSGGTIKPKSVGNKQQSFSIHGSAKLSTAGLQAEMCLFLIFFYQKAIGSENNLVLETHTMSLVQLCSESG